MAVNAAATPKWADFPADEYMARVDKAQRLMREQGLDALLMVQRENVEYFSGFLTGHWNSKTFSSGAVLIPARGEPILIIPDFFSGTADGSSWMSRRLYYTKPHAQPRGFQEQVLAGIELVGAKTGTIGLEMGENLTPGWNLVDYQAIRDGLSAAEFRSGADVIWGCRRTKSPLELERMRLVTRISDAAILGTKAQLRVGATEEDVARLTSQGMFEHGADGISFMNIRAGLDRYPMADSLPEPRPIALGEMLLIDVGCRRRTYSTDVAYVAHVGKPTPEHLAIYDTVIRSHEATLAALRPGAKVSDVYWAGLKVLEGYGSGKFLDMIGHGIGMDVHEPPIITPYDHSTIEAGMVFAIEPWFYDVTRLGFFCVEEIVAVTEEGIEIMSSIPRNELWTVE